MNPVAIEVRHVSKRFGRRSAVEDLSFSVPAGAVCGLLGHNGAGKSTVIGMILGQVWPDAGEVRVQGWEVTRHRDRALARVGALFETPAFYEELSARRNLEIFSSYTAPVSRAEIANALQRVGLNGSERAPVRTFSHGMRMRLALAQALLPGPEILILDEPGEGLDPEGMYELRQMIRQLHRDLRLTILFSSHRLSEVEELCTHLVVLRQGRKVFDGPWDRLQSASNLVRLEVEPFAEAVAALAREGLIRHSGRDPEGGWVIPAPGVETDTLARRLVESGYRLREIHRPRASLESLYLSLMQRPTPPVTEVASTTDRA